MARHVNIEYIPDTDKPPKEPLTFNVRGETFTCVDEIPAMLTLEFGLIQNPDAEEWERTMVISSFIDAAVIEQDRERFRTALKTATPTIGIEELMFMVNKLLEAITTIPTEGQQDSPSSLPSTPSSSTDAPSQQVIPEGFTT